MVLLAVVAIGTARHSIMRSVGAVEGQAYAGYVMELVNSMTLCVSPASVQVDVGLASVQA